MKDLLSVCITCMGRGHTLISVQDFGQGKITYSVKLRTCLPIVNSKHYDLNCGFLCKVCATSVDDYFTFYQTCVQTKWNLEKEILKKVNAPKKWPLIINRKENKNQDVTNVTISDNGNNKKNDGINDGSKQTVNKYIVIANKDVNSVIETKNKNRSQRVIIRTENVNNGNQNITNETGISSNGSNRVITGTNDVGNKVKNIVNEIVEVNNENNITDVVDKIDDRNNVIGDSPVSEQVMIKIEDEETFNKIEDNEMEDPLKIDEKSNDLNVTKNDYENVDDLLEIDIVEDEIKLEEIDEEVEENPLIMTTEIEILEDDYDGKVTNKLHRCNYCEKIFKQSNELQVHLKTDHASEIVIKCTICSNIYSEKRNYHAHIINNHSDEFQFVCEPCRMPFRTETELIEHKNLKKCFIKGNFNCDYCSSKFSREISLENHVKSAHKNEKCFTCMVCRLKFPKKYSLMLHMKKMHSDKLFSCVLCKESFINTLLLKQHALTHSRNSYCICQCGKMFLNTTELLTHQKSHHAKRLIPKDRKTNKPNSYHCDKCDKSFMHQINLIKHIRKHLEQIHPCKYCSLKFKHKSHLNSHISIIHARQMCHICGKQLKINYMEEHLNMHKGIKSYLCYICGELFSHNGTLFRHQKIHTGDYTKYPCTYCTKIFKNKNDLNNHTRTHTGEKPFSCKLCGKSFAVKRQVTVHINSAHLEKKPYVCEICHQDCPTMHSLKLHKVKHTNARPFSCPICLASYKTKNILNRHLNKSSCSKK